MWLEHACGLPFVHAGGCQGNQLRQDTAHMHRASCVAARSQNTDERRGDTGKLCHGWQLGGSDIDICRCGRGAGGDIANDGRIWILIQYYEHNTTRTARPERQDQTSTAYILHISARHNATERRAQRRPGSPGTGDTHKQHALQRYRYTTPWAPGIWQESNGKGGL